MTSSAFVITARQASPTRLECRASVPNDLVFFSGHFEGYPVLAAVAQLDALVLELIEEHYPDLGALRGCARLKFRQAIGPGDELTVVISRESEEATALTFSIGHGGGTCSEGRLQFGNPGDKSEQA